jgi:hypothetical protein
MCAVYTLLLLLLLLLAPCLIRLVVHSLHLGQRLLGSNAMGMCELCALLEKNFLMLLQLSVFCIHTIFITLPTVVTVAVV